MTEFTHLNVPYKNLKEARIRQSYKIKDKDKLPLTDHEHISRMVPKYPVSEIHGLFTKQHS